MEKKHYFTKSKNILKYTLARYNFLTKIQLTIYSVISIIGKIIFFTRPIFEVSDNNLARMIVETRFISISKVFEGVKERYLSLLLNSLIQNLKLLGVVVIVSLPVIIGCLIAYPLAFMEDGGEVITAFFLASFIALGVILGYLLRIKHYGVAYCLTINPSFSLADAMENSHYGVKGYRWSIILSKVLIFLIFAVLVLFSVLPIVLYNEVYIKNMPNVFLMVMLLIFVAFSLLSVIYCFFISRFYLILLVKNYLVYKENISEARPIIVRPLAGEKEDYEPLFVDSSKDISLINKKEEE